MNDQKTIKEASFVLFEDDECFPDISIMKTTEENNRAIDAAFRKLKELADKEMEKSTFE